MKLQFKQQGYQEEATKAIIDIFNGQSKLDISGYNVYKHELKDGEQTKLELDDISSDVDIIANPKLHIEDIYLKKNIEQIQKGNNIPTSDFKNLTDFSIEMETGTGKTYTYINSMYQLYEKYNFSKFIIVVPSVAIREGVSKSLEITAEHFQELYKHKIRFSIYKSTNPKALTDFTGGSGIQCIIMNYQAFNTKSKDSRKIYEQRDEFGSNSPIDLIKACRPIMIIDEPQKISDNAEKIINESFNPLFKLRFSATHKVGSEYNKVYSLDAVDAYNQKLVKKIEVIGLEILDDKSEGTYVYVSDIVATNKTPKATIEIEIKTINSVVKKEITVFGGENLFYKSNELTSYKDNWVVSEINAHPDHMYIEFLNGQKLNINSMVGEEDDLHRYRAQIKETIKAHLNKEQILLKKGIKVLTLFFIDKVANYRNYGEVDDKGFLATMFEELYTELIAQQNLDQSYREYLNHFNAEEVHNGYFSIDKKGKVIDSKETKESGSTDESAYDLILKNKERLLSFEEPTRFIFSHSALREGWDNPNVFQICTLKESKSEINKRQEIGRGLRICVNKHGERMDLSKLESEFHDYNTLTVIASESYDSFTKSLQDEIAKELKDKRINFDSSLLFNKNLKNSSDMVITITGDINDQITECFIKNGYVDMSTHEVTNKFKKAMKDKKVIVPEILEDHHDQFCHLLDEEFFNRSYKIENRGSKNIRSDQFKANENMKKNEFISLWSKINKKSTYVINFDSDVLIENAVPKLDEIHVGRIKVKKTIGSQKEESSKMMLKENIQFTYGSSSTEKIEEFSESNIKYDLLGEVKKHTGLKRATIARALNAMKKSAFDEFKYNPDKFIIEVAKILNEQKATCIISQIKYIKTDKIFSNDVFVDNNLNGQLGKDVFEVKKHIYDYVKVDSNVERDFVKDLDNNDEVIVYVKLPGGFKINTPVGSYNPDWAMVIDNELEKFVYFIAETKGTNNVEKLKGDEQLKINCARKHFKAISEDNVHYDVVSNYGELVNIIERVCK